MSPLEELNAAKETIKTLNAQLASLPGLNTQVASLTAEITQLKADVTTAQAATVAATEKGKTDLAAAKAAHATELAAKEAEVETKAAAKAAAIVAGTQGAAPIVTKPADNPAGKQEQKPEVKGRSAQERLKEEFDNRPRW